MASTPLLHQLSHHHRRRRHYIPTFFHPLKTPTSTTRRRTFPPTTAAAGTISMSYTPTPAVDRFISAASYALPFFNSLHYGHHLLSAYPPVSAVLLEPILPIFSLYRSIPYASFVAFFALYLGVVRNPSLSRYVRFNAMQALVLDVLLALPLLLARILSPGRARLVSQVVAVAHTALFVFVAACFVYGLVSCVLGRTPHIPFVADAAARQL